MHVPIFWPRVPSVRELAERELDEAQRDLLKAQSVREAADANVRYHEARIKRLSRVARGGAQ